jgi:alpha-L-fucosidase 2
VEHIQLNEETIWAGQPNQVVNPNAREALPEVRRLIFEGKYKEAQELANAKVMPNAAGKNMGMPYQPFGDLYVAMPGHAEYSGYERWLDLDNARSVVRYTMDGVQYERETIAPLGCHHVIAMHLTASKKGKITFTASMTSPHENVLIGSDPTPYPSPTGAGSGCAYLLGVSSKHEGLKGKVRFMGRLAVDAKGGKVSHSNGIVSVVGADEATLYVTVGTNVRSYKDITGDEAQQSMERLSGAMAMGYEALKALHERTYHQYYDRVRFELGDDHYATVPMNKRIEHFRVVSDSLADNYLVATYFQFGRYLLISSSQPDNKNPANLQGIWNDKLSRRGTRSTRRTSTSK